MRTREYPPCQCVELMACPGVSATSPDIILMMADDPGYALPHGHCRVSEGKTGWARRPAAAFRDPPPPPPPPHEPPLTRRVDGFTPGPWAEAARLSWIVPGRGTGPRPCDDPVRRSYCGIPVRGRVKSERGAAHRATSPMLALSPGAPESRLGWFG